METVRIWHPSLPHTRQQPAVVTRRSFDICWSQPQLPHRPDGWQLWPPEDALPEPPAARATRQAWAEHAEALGLKVAKKDTKAAIVTKVETHRAKELGNG